MLVIQNICLTWGKDERGGRCADARSRFPEAWPLKGFPPNSAEAVENSLNFWQDGPRILDAFEENRRLWRRGGKASLKGFSGRENEKRAANREQYIKRYLYRAYNAVADVNIANLSIGQKEGAYQAKFYDSRRGGAPLRRGHNEDFLDKSSAFYGKDVLNETAFTLKPGQYGRIVYNERKTGYDTGTWYYQLHIINLVYCIEEMPAPDLFISKQPDYNYRQLAGLF